MTADARTEARAVLSGMERDAGYDLVLNRLATALAAKDAELARRDMQLEASAKVALDLSAQLAEANKALDRIIALDSSIDATPRGERKVVYGTFAAIARRAREAGGGNG